MEMTVKFGSEKQTKGAIRFKELDAGGKFIDNPSDGKIGTFYVRKSELPEGFIPATVSVAFTFSA